MVGTAERSALQKYLNNLEASAKESGGYTRSAVLEQANARLCKEGFTGETLKSSTVSGWIKNGTVPEDFRLLWAFANELLHRQRTSARQEGSARPEWLVMQEARCRGFWEAARNSADRREMAALTCARRAGASGLPPGPISNLPPRNPAFTGRSDLLQQIAARLDNGPVAVVAMRGLGGIGKSTLALEYAHQERESGRSAIVWWVRADSSITLSTDLTALALALGIDVRSDEERVLQKLMTVLATRDDWLIVYDNAERPRDLSQRLPGRGHVLITSRFRTWTGVATAIDISTLDTEESVELLIRRSERDERGPAALLAEELGYLPLALAQAASYADAYGIGLAHYLELYHEAAPRLLAAGLDSDEYPHSVATTWQLHVDQLRRKCPAALELLRICAFLAPTTIPLNLVFSDPVKLPEPLARAAVDPVERTETVGALAVASLVTVVEGDCIQLHRLVQAVTRYQLDDAQRARYLHTAGAVVTEATPTSWFPPDSWPAAELWSPHALAVAKCTARSEPAVAHRLYRGVATYLSERGHYKDAERAVTEAHNLLARTGGSDAVGDLYTLAISSSIKCKRGDLVGAREDLRRVRTEITMNRLHPHPAMVELLVQCATVERHLGNLPTALKDLNLADGIAQALRAPKLWVLVASNRALVAQAAGDLELAEDNYQKVLKWRQEHLKQTDHRIGFALSNLATIHLKQDKTGTAVKEYTEALVILEKELGPDHPEVATLLNNLAQAYLEQDNLKQAEPLFERALEIKQDRLGRSTPEVAQILAMQSQILLRRGNTVDARRLAAEAHHIFRDCLGPNHQDTRKVSRLMQMIQ